MNSTDKSGSLTNLLIIQRFLTTMNTERNPFELTDAITWLLMILIATLYLFDTVYLTMLCLGPVGQY